MLGPLVENSFMLPPSNKVIYQNNLFLLYHDNQVALETKLLINYASLSKGGKFKSATTRYNHLLLLHWKKDLSLHSRMKLLWHQ